jgi:D-aminopeptidase
MRLHHATSPDLLTPTAEGTLAAGGIGLRKSADGLWMDRAGENRSSRLLPVGGTPMPDIEGSYHCAELDATLAIVAAGGVLYGAFSGFLGRGEMHQLIPYAEDIWLLPCPRALDYGAPGDWTVRVRRDGGAVAGLSVGCWLARDVAFSRL